MPHIFLLLSAVVLILKPELATVLGALFAGVSAAAAVAVCRRTPERASVWVVVIPHDYWWALYRDRQVWRDPDVHPMPAGLLVPMAKRSHQG